MEAIRGMTIVQENIAKIRPDLDLERVDISYLIRDENCDEFFWRIGIILLKGQDQERYIVFITGQDKKTYELIFEKYWTHDQLITLQSLFLEKSDDIYNFFDSVSPKITITNKHTKRIATFEWDDNLILSLTSLS